MIPVDDLILTASSRAQARGYLYQLQARRRLGALDQCHRFLVAPDPGGRRVGSGTATLFALRALVRRIRRERGNPALAVEDALNGRRVLIIHSGGDSRRLIAYAAQGKIFTPLPLADRPPEASALCDLIVDDLTSIEFPNEGGVLIASGDVLLDVARQRLRFRGDGVQAVAWPSSIERGARHGVYVADAQGRVIDVLQKPDEVTARARGAVDARDCVLIDTGLVFVPSREAARWLSVAETVGVFDDQDARLDLYSDVLPALVNGGSAAAFLRGIGGAGMRVQTIHNCLFFHIGTTRELLARLTDQGGGGPDVLRKAREPSGDACAFASIIPDGSIVAGPAVIESCWLQRAPRLGGDNVLVGVPRECAAAVQLQRGHGLVCLPLGNEDWTAIGFGIDDDVKTPRERGGTFAGRPLTTIDRACWGEDDDHTLWSAQLWQIGSATSAVEHAMAVLKNPQVAGVRRLHSAAELISRVNHRRLVDHRRDVVRDAAFQTVARSVERQIAFPTKPRPGAIQRGEVVRVSAPVRIDLAGGWSDTPPICNDVGGAVVNVAVRLDGAQPIRAEARLIEQPVVRVRSVDLNREITFTSAEQIAAHRDPDDWAALPKAALVLSGIAPRDSRVDLQAWLEALGGGVELTIASALPKGSGLGASSILGAATLACLARVVGEHVSREDLIARTSALEQMMSTAGGWQDQAGGISGGAKLLTTELGSQQVPREQGLTIPLDFWRERVLLYSTGLQRLARDILQNVVWRWLGGGADVRGIVRHLREGAFRMRDDLLAGDLESFSRGVLTYWELKKAIDPGATNPQIEAIIEPLRPWLSAYELPGAGGGGFLFMIAHDSEAAQRVRRRLSDHPPNPRARFFDAEIDETGLVVELIAPAGET